MAKGRPKKSDDDRRTKRVVVRMTEAEHSALTAAARAAGVSLAVWMRRAEQAPRAKPMPHAPT